MDPAELIDETFGPYPFHVSPDQVREFITVVGDAPHRWTRAAPPGFMAAALFVVAPELLSKLEGRSVIHGEQSFTWNRALEMGSVLSVTGTVTRSRDRAGVHFTTFEIDVLDSEGVLASGTSLFLIAGEVPPGKSDAVQDEPAPYSRADDGGDDLVSASRSDLVRYAAATRDWNPIHWDHRSAVEAGLPRVVVHGLLQAAWAFRTATLPTIGDNPLLKARVRFRNPMLAGEGAEVHSEWTDNDVNVTLVGGEGQTFITARIEFADE